jgi:hypothetical protein
MLVKVIYDKSSQIDKNVGSISFLKKKKERETHETCPLRA